MHGPKRIVVPKEWQYEIPSEILSEMEEGEWEESEGGEGGGRKATTIGVCQTKRKKLVVALRRHKL